MNFLFHVRLVTAVWEDQFFCDKIVSRFDGEIFEFYYDGKLKRMALSDEIKFYGIEVLSR